MKEILGSKPMYQSPHVQDLLDDINDIYKSIGFTQKDHIDLNEVGQKTQDCSEKTKLVNLHDNSEDNSWMFMPNTTTTKILIPYFTMTILVSNFEGPLHPQQLTLHPTSLAIPTSTNKVLKNDIQSWAHG